MSTPGHLASMRRPSRVQDGFSLIEVLIAVTILSIGLLGISGLVVSTFKSNDDAAMRSRATILANAILDNMRANLTDAGLGSGSTYNVGNITTWTGTGGCVGSACSASSIATTDLANWQALLSSSLPGYGGSIAVSVSGSYITAAVTVTWNNTRSAAAFESQGAACATAGTCTASISLQSVLE